MPLLPWRFLTIILAAIAAGLALWPLLQPGAGAAVPAITDGEGQLLRIAALLAAALAALAVAVLARGRGVVSLGFGVLGALLLAGDAAAAWLEAPPLSVGVAATAGLVCLILATVTERRPDPFANSAHTAARRLGVPQRQPRRG